MKLPFPFFQNNKKQESEYFLALLLTDEKTSAVILKEHLGKLQVIGKHEEFFSTPLETVETEALISIIDKTISSAEEILPPDVETHKTVFGLKDDWIEQDSKKIKKEYLSKLKKVCDSLDLTPIGFMVVTEAISNLLQEEEGAPLSAILAEVGKKSVALTLFRGGKITERTEGLIEDSAAQTVDKLLKNFTTAVLPARIILYDAHESEKLSQKFIGHKWSQSLPFLHVPQIIALPEGSDARAVVFGAGLQMGLEVSGVRSGTADQVKTEDAAAFGFVGSEDTKEEVIDEKSADVKDEEKDAEINLEQAADEEKDVKEDLKSDAVISSDNFGFVTDQDIVDLKPQKEEPLSENKQSFHVNLDQQDNEDYEERAESMTEQRRANPIIPSIAAFLGNIRLPNSFSSFRNGERRFIFPLAILAGLLILIGGISYFYFANVKANIVLTVKPKMVDESTTVIFSGTSSSDFSKNIISTKNIETTIKGEMAIDTTGKKDVGNKAKGTVTVYNSGNSSAKLESGTNIKSTNNLVFLLDKDLTIASASGDIFSGTKPGTADVAITAKDIGTDSNLPSGTKFTVGSNSNLAAKNDSAFSGGSKKQVQVVSKNDIEKLRKDLPKSLEAKAHTDIIGKASGDEKVLPLLLTLGLDSQKFDKDIDDESKKVKLTANVKFLGMSYQENDLIDYSKSLLKNKYSQDIAFADNSIKNEIKDAIEKKDKQIEAMLSTTAGLLPNINVDEIAQKAKGKSQSETRDMLAKLPQVVDTKINFSPNIPLLPNLFPKLPNQITVEVKSE